MDFSYVSELQELIMRTYRESAEARNPKRPSRAVPADMAFVPGGYVLVGDPSAKLGQPEFPSRVVYVSPFLIDKYEVSNAQYRQFVEYVQRTRDESMEHPDAPPLKKHDAKGWETPGLAGDDQPVVGVDWFDAYAYAKWKKKRLPTEAEWEKAARGLDGRMYPWGEESPEQQAANYDEGRRHLAREMDRQNPPKAVEQKGGGGCFRKSEPPPPPPPTMLPKTTWPVKMALAPQATKAVDRDELTWKRSTVNAYGCLHMAGNAAEWVADYYEKEAYVRMDARNPQGPASGTFRAYRGGSYLSQRAPELLAYRRWGAIKATQGGTTQGREAFIGFRCVIPLE
jgi:formylglycine-generating enzyme required for sulfatase activity